MGLWKSIKRLLPAGLLLATSFFFLSQRERILDLEEKVVQKRSEEWYDNPRVRWFASGLGAGATALGLAYALQRLRGKKQTFLQPAVENPAIAGGISGVITGLTYYAQIPHALLTVPMSVLTGTLAYMGFSFLSYVKPPYLLNTARSTHDAFCDVFTKDPAKKQANLERMREYFAKPVRIDLDLCHVLWQQNKFDESLELLSRTVPRTAELVEGSLFERKIVQPATLEALTRMKSTHPLELAYAHIRNGEYGDAGDALDRFVSEDKTPTRCAVRAYVLQNLLDLLPRLAPSLPKKKEVDALALAQRVKNSWKATITAILDDPGAEQRFRLLGESRNEVFEYELNEFLKGLLVLKRCDAQHKARLEREHRTMQYLEKQFPGRIVPSLAYAEHDGKAYHVTRRKTSRTLEDVLTTGSPEERMRKLIDAADLLARLHNADFPESSDAVPRNYCSGRLISVFYDQLVGYKGTLNIPQGLKERLPRVGDRIQKEFAGALFGRYTDNNPRNRLDESPIMATDFEHNVELPVPLELVSMLEFGLTPATDDERKAAISQYALTAGVDVSQVTYGHGPFGLQRHLEFAGYRLRDNAPLVARAHIDRAAHYADSWDEKELAGDLRQVIVAVPSVDR